MGVRTFPLRSLGGDCWALVLDPRSFRRAGRPVYAPALVAFVGLGAGVAVGAALASRSIGWVPLGPREPFRPWYHASDRYMRAVNVNHVTHINNNVTIEHLHQSAAATVSMPGPDMVRSGPVQSVAQPMTEQEFAGSPSHHRPAPGPSDGRDRWRDPGGRSRVQPASGNNLAACAGPRWSAATSRARRRPALAGHQLVFQGASNRQSSIYSVGGSPPFQPGRIPAPSLAPPNAFPPGMPRPQYGQRPQISPSFVRPQEPTGIVPNGIIPGAPRPGVGFLPGPVVHSEPRPLPQVVTPSYPGPQQIAPPPHTEPPRVAPPQAPLPRIAAPAPMPHFEPQRAVPHQEPPHFAAPAPARQAVPFPAAREKRPGER